MNRVCAKCGIEFRPWRDRQRFCSHGCHDESRKKVDVKQLQHLVFTGATKAEIAREMGVSYITVRRWVDAYGFENTWREQRYA